MSRLSHRPMSRQIMAIGLFLLGLVSVGCQTLGARSAEHEAAAYVRDPAASHSVTEVRRPAQNSNSDVQTVSAEFDEQTASRSRIWGHSRFAPRPSSDDRGQPGNNFLRAGLDPSPEGPLTLPDRQAGRTSRLNSWSDDALPPGEETVAHDDAAGGELFSDGEPPAITLGDDLCSLFPTLWDDTLSLINWKNALILGAGAGATIAIRDDWDGRVRHWTAKEPTRWGEGSEVLRQFGEPQYQLPVLAGSYALSLWAQDEQFHNFNKALISAYAINGMTTVAIKGITNTSRPTNVYQNGHYGFPSFHASSTFTFASVVDEYYGWKLGVPAYALAGLVGWSRIDQREHDLSDVLFGSLLGFVIGHTVAAAHIDRESGFQVAPYYDPANNATGVMFEKSF